MKLCGFNIGINYPIFLIAGPCVIESESLTIDIAGFLKDICKSLNMPFIYKASFDKANRSLINSYRGPGLEKGLIILDKVKSQINVPILTDVHEDTPLSEVSTVVDVLQIPAFLCRQTNFIHNVSVMQKPVNIKKGQFLSPIEMKYVIEKARSFGNENIMICERGTSFGYHDIISDMRSLRLMREDTSCPIIYDITHSSSYIQEKHNINNNNIFLQRKFIPTLARSAVAAGISGIFIETHPKPRDALSDSYNSWPLYKIKNLLEILQSIDNIIKSTNID